VLPGAPSAWPQPGGAPWGYDSLALYVNAEISLYKKKLFPISGLKSVSENANGKYREGKLLLRILFSE
jgi:hypothetical protein